MHNAVPSDTLLTRLKAAHSVCVLTGAGVSAESGIPTFRGQGGLWKEFRPEELATPEAFERNPHLVWEWYMWRRGLVSQALPNPGHLALAALESHVAEFTLVTQNVDGLHQRAGSRNLVEIHGNITRSRCHSCGAPSGSAAPDPDGQLPACGCGGLIRPDVVWFGELLPQQALQQAGNAVQGSDVFLSVGTSSAVYPAAGLADMAKGAGAYLVEVNPEKTAMSGLFDEILRGPSGVILPLLCRELGLNISPVEAVAC
jgi:NAD-dependent deacetylase